MDQTEHAVIYDLNYGAGTGSFLNVVCIKYASDNAQCSYYTHRIGTTRKACILVVASNNVDVGPRLYYLQ
jgi:uncharacterized cysteine cluster protein YcgN (CxxCxxCC family)